MTHSNPNTIQKNRRLRLIPGCLSQSSRSRQLIFGLFILSALLCGDPLSAKAEKIDFESSNLPIVIIETNGQVILARDRTPASMDIIWNGEGERNRVTDKGRNYSGHIAIELHGKSSLGFDKKSYRIETQDDQGNNNNVSLLGLPEENDWIFYGPYSDKSLMRNALTYTLAGLINSYAPRVRFCELMVNGDYKGINVLTEKIKRDKNRIDIAELSPEHVDEPDINGGYIFKKDKTDPGDNIISLDRGLNLVITEPKKDLITPEQTRWLKNHLNQFEDALYSGRKYEDFIDEQSFVDNFILVELGKNIDGFRLSTYFHKDRGGKIVAGPVWDYNLALGNADYNDGWTPEGWYYPIISNWDKSWSLELIEDDYFFKLCEERWEELRKGPLSKENIFSQIDEWTDLLSEAQERNFLRYPILGEYIWPNPGFPESGSYNFESPTTGGPDTWEEEIEFLKWFIDGRLVWMDEEFGLDTILTEQDNLVRGFRLEQNYPNPFNPSTTIPYSIDKAGWVELRIFDLLGREVDVLVNEFQEENDYQVAWHPEILTSGVYVYALKSGSFYERKKLLIIR